MPNLRCPYCGVVLDGDRSVKHQIDCPFCHSTFVPRQKGVNRMLQTLLIMAILAAISVTVLVIAGLVNPQSAVSFGLLLLALFALFVGLWFGGRAVYMHLIWRDEEDPDEILDLRRLARNAEREEERSGEQELATTPAPESDAREPAAEGE
jgi:hypothetical protein